MLNVAEMERLEWLLSKDDLTEDEQDELELLESLAYDHD